VARSRVAPGYNAGREPAILKSSHFLQYFQVNIGILPQKKTICSTSLLIIYYCSTALRTAPYNKHLPSCTGTICFSRWPLLKLFIYLFTHSFSKLVGWFVALTWVRTADCPKSRYGDTTILQALVASLTHSEFRTAINFNIILTANNTLGNASDHYYSSCHTVELPVITTIFFSRSPHSPNKTRRLLL
jgi:hypothetical protein